MTRTLLPARRQSYSTEFDHDGIHYHSSASIYGNVVNKDIQWGEVFLTATGRNTNSQIGAMAADSAVLVSLALQYGTPLHALRKALGRDSSLDSGETGAEQNNPEVVTYSGPIGVMLDCMAKWRDEWLSQQKET